MKKLSLIPVVHIKIVPQTLFGLSSIKIIPEKAKRGAGCVGKKYPIANPCYPRSTVLNPFPIPIPIVAFVTGFIPLFLPSVGFCVRSKKRKRRPFTAEATTSPTITKHITSKPKKYNTKFSLSLAVCLMPANQKPKVTLFLSKKILQPCFVFVIIFLVGLCFYV